MVVTTLAATFKRPPDPAHARSLLAEVCDPEIPVLTIADLGILRAIDVDGDTLVISITPTYSGCPAMDTIAADIATVLTEAGYRVRVQTVLEPAWTTDWLTPAGRAKLRAYGIAPPVGASTEKRSLLGAAVAVQCPHCDSDRTHKLSEFGSTACKALYACDACQQPFDYFKCF